MKPILVFEQVGVYKQLLSRPLQTEDIRTMRIFGGPFNGSTRAYCLALPAGGGGGGGAGDDAMAGVD